jgi:hypothetical protein
MLRSNIQYFVMSLESKQHFHTMYTPQVLVFFNIQALGNSTNQSIILEALEMEPILPFKSLHT